MKEVICKRYSKFLGNEYVENLTNNIAERFMLKVKLKKS